MRPNIVLIMVDDMGYSDIGCYGGEIETPNLDRLAERGVRFTNFYNCARCCPTRASLLTGLYPHQAGIGHMTAPHNQGPETPAYQGYLNDTCVTLAEVLRTGGYATMMSGKWHVGGGMVHDDPALRPRSRGFDRFWGIASGGTHYFTPHRTRRQNAFVPAMLLDDDQPVEADGYFTDMISDRAVTFIKERPKDDPFFLYVAYTAPHWPLHAPEDVVAKYKERYLAGWDAIREKRFARQIELGLVDPATTLTPRDPGAPPWNEVIHKEWEATRMAVYAAQVDIMDQGVGRIVRQLEAEGILDDTLIMFLSDNGGCAEPLPDNHPEITPGGPDTWASYGLPWANASNTPFRLYKHWVHEGGIATPFIIHWPRLNAAPNLISTPAHLIDVMATCVDVAGCTYPSERRGRPIPPMEGVSLKPALRGEGLPERTLFWEHEGNRAVRQGPWKLVSLLRGTGHARMVLPTDVDESWHLYNLETDRTESVNLAEEFPERVAEMRSQYEAWAERVGVGAWPVRLPDRKSGK